MTKKQQATMQMTMVPFIVIVFLVLAAGYLLLKGDFKFPKFNTGPQIRRLENFPTIVYTDKELERQRKVIKSQQELNEFLNYVDSTGLLVIKENINFEKEYLIAASTVLNNETGRKIKIKKIYQEKDKKGLIVSIEESEQGQNCEVDNDKNVAVDLVAISKTDWDIDFERIKKTEACKAKQTTNTEDQNSEAVSATK